MRRISSPRSIGVIHGRSRNTKSWRHATQIVRRAVGIYRALKAIVVKGGHLDGGTASAGARIFVELEEGAGAVGAASSRGDDAAEAGVEAAISFYAVGGGGNGRWRRCRCRCRRGVGRRRYQCGVGRRRCRRGRCRRCWKCFHAAYTLIEPHIHLG